MATLVSSVGVIAPSRALETPIATTAPASTVPAPGPAATTDPVAKASLVVKVGIVERAVELDWARARHIAPPLAPSGARLAPGAEAMLKVLVGGLKMTGDQRERYLLFARATDPKPSAPDLQLRARIVRNALVAAASAPQDAIVVATWASAGDPPGSAEATRGVTGGFVLVPIVATSDPAQARALALDSAFAGIAELSVAPTTPPTAAPSTAPARPSGDPAPIAVPRPPAAPAVAPPASIAAPAPPAPPRPTVTARPAVAAPAPAPAKEPNPGASAAPKTTASLPAKPSAATALAALLPLPKARPTVPPSLQAPQPPSRIGATTEPPPPPRPTPRAVAVDRPDEPAKPRVTAPRPPTAKAEPARRPASRIANCAPPRVILDDFYPGGPIIACDGSRR